MMKNFNNYLIQIGIRSTEFTYSDETLYDNMEYFERKFKHGTSAFTALNLLCFELEKNKKK